jgi:peptidoglycan/xylan/chitin deacetylase (PgdA/CDA1 family)
MKTLEKINKVNGQKITQEDILKIDDNSEIIESSIKDIISPITQDKPIITFIDDDGTSASYTRTYPVFKAQGISATFALVTDFIGTSNHFTLSQIQQLKNEGFDFVSHSKTHSTSAFYTDLANTSDNILETEFKDSKQWFKDNGLGECETIVYPFANFDNHVGVGQEIRVKSIAKKYYNYGVNADGWYNLSPNDNMYIKRYFADFPSGDTLDNVKSVIDNAFSNNGWLILGIHAFDNNQFPTNQLESVIDYIKSKNITVLNFKDAIEYKKNVISVGEFTDRTKGLFIGRDGNVLNNAENCKVITNNYGYTTDDPLSRFAEKKLSIVSIESTGDKIENVGGNLFVYNGGNNYGNEIFIGYYGQKMYIRYWDSANSIWNPWVELTATLTPVSTNSYTSIFDSPVDWYTLNKITNVYIKVGDDSFKNVGGMYNVYHGAIGCSYSTFQPISEFKTYKRLWNNTTSVWGSWNAML